MLLIIAIACNCCAAVLFLLAAMKYGFGPVPLTYHKLMLEKEGTTLSPYMTSILKAQYRAFAGAMLAIGIMILVLTMGPIRQDVLWAQVVVLLGGVAFVTGSSLTPFRVEQETKIQTPWRLSLLMGAFIVAGFVLAVWD